jgi:hypothetical protein
MAVQQNCFSYFKRCLLSNQGPVCALRKRQTKRSVEARRWWRSGPRLRGRVQQVSTAGAIAKNRTGSLRSPLHEHLIGPKALRHCRLG